MHRAQISKQTKRFRIVIIIIILHKNNESRKLAFREII